MYKEGLGGGGGERAEVKVSVGCVSCSQSVVTLSWRFIQGRVIYYIAKGDHLFYDFIFFFACACERVCVMQRFKVV